MPKKPSVKPSSTAKGKKKEAAGPPKPTAFTTIRALSENRPLSYKDIRKEGWPYEAFLINRAFSLNPETIMMAAMMNERPNIDRDMHAAFYIATLRPRRRFESWPKELKDDEVKVLCDYYGMSPREARLHRGLHTVDQLTEMKRLLQDGVRFTRQP